MLTVSTKNYSSFSNLVNLSTYTKLMLKGRSKIRKSTYFQTPQHCRKQAMQTLERGPFLPNHVLLLFFCLINAHTTCATSVSLENKFVDLLKDQCPR